MSRIGRVPIIIPEGVTVEQDAQTLKAKGSKGELTLEIHPKIKIEIKDKEITVSMKNNDKLARSLYGLSQRLVSNLVIGVSKGFEKKLEIKGVGYRASQEGKKINLTLGFSHPVVVDLPEGIEGKVQKNIITISGIDKQLVGEVAANIRAYKKPEPYKGKGIRYVGEFVKRKVGKAAKTSGGA